MTSEGAFRALVERVDQLVVSSKALEEKIAELAAAKEARRQPDWRTVSDASIAHTILLSIDDWLTKSAIYLGVQVPDCWAWHPAAVVRLLAISQHDRASYAGSQTVAVVDLLVNRVPSLTKDQVGIGVACRAAHVEPDGCKYTIQRDEWPDLATWWATTRTGLAPGLYPLSDTSRLRLA